MHEALHTTSELNGVKFIDKLIEKMKKVEKPAEDEYVTWWPLFMGLFVDDREMGIVNYARVCANAPLKKGGKARMR